MKHFIIALMLAFCFAACNDGSDPNRVISSSGETVKVSDFEVAQPEGCVKVLDYYVLQETYYLYPAWDIIRDVLKCLDKDGRRSAFYKSFGRTEWNKRYIRGKMNAEAAY